MKKNSPRAKQRASRSSKAAAFADPRLRAVQAFGGTLFRKARYRRSRPLSTKKSIHLVLRSTQAKGSRSFQTSKNWKAVEKLCFEFAARYKVQIESYVNGGNHLHLMIRLKNRLSYAPFIRALTGAIALKITGANRNHGNEARFWDFRPFTALVENAKNYAVANDYVTLNLLKNLRIVPRFKAHSYSVWPLHEGPLNST